MKWIKALNMFFNSLILVQIGLTCVLCASVVPTGCSQESTSRREPGGVCSQSLHSGKLIRLLEILNLLQFICRNVGDKIQCVNSFICKNNPWYYTWKWATKSVSERASNEKILQKLREGLLVIECGILILRWFEVFEDTHVLTLSGSY